MAYGRTWASAAILAALAACGQAAEGFQLTLEAPGRDGVQAVIAVEHHPATSFESITQKHPESSIDGAVIEGKSFSAPSELYLIRLTLKNGTGKELRAPELTVLPAEEPQVTFRTRARSVPAGGEAQFLYLWDPGHVVRRATARLTWAP